MTETHINAPDTRKNFSICEIAVHNFKIITTQFKGNPNHVLLAALASLTAAVPPGFSVSVSDQERKLSPWDST